MLDLVNKNHIMISLFKNLPINHKISIAQYFSLNNSIWKVPEQLEQYKYAQNDLLLLDEEYHKYIEFYDVQYGNYLFGMVNISIFDLINKVILSNELQDYKGNWAKYHKYILDSFTIPNYIKLCPVLIAINNPKCEVIEDGWIRLHDYYKKGIQIIPCVFHFFITNYSLITF